MNYDANLGIGNSTGMAFWAPIDTGLPEYPSEVLTSEDWTLIGAVSEDGISYSPNRDLTPLRNWSKEIERLLTSDSDGELEVPLLYTNDTTFKLIFSEDAVTVTNATQTHGKLISVNIDPNETPEGKAFVFLMKDGDDMMMIATRRGFITSVSDVAFSPSDAIVWTATISAKNWVFMKDNTQVTQ